MSRRLRKRASLRMLGTTLSVAIHCSVLLILLWPRSEAPQAVEPPPMIISLVQTPKPAPPATPEPVKTPTPTPAVQHPQAATQPASRHPAQSRSRPSPRPSPSNHAEAEPTDDTPSAGPPAVLSDAEMAGAASADGAPGGGPCDMARRLQAALRKDRLVQAAVAQSGLAPSSGKALLVWQGDWVQSQGEEGKGLSAVREAVAWEVGFSPAACRAEPVHGYILFSLGGPGSIRLAMGASAWRWSDLLK